MNTLKFGNGEWYGKKDTILAYNDLNSNYKPLPFNFSRASKATVINKDGLIETVGSGQPRIDYKDDSKGALKLEPSRTNLITYSSDFANPYWTKNSASIQGDPSTVGSELIVNGDFATDSVWAKDTGWTISGGLLNCNTTTSNNTRQLISSYSTSKVYLITYTVSNYVSGGVRIDLGYNNGATRTANGTYTEQMSFVDSGAFNGYLRIFSNGASNLKIDNVSVKEVQGFTSLDGTNNAYKLVEGTNNGNHSISATVLVNSGDNSFSMYVKENGRKHISLYTNSRGSENDQYGFYLNGSGSVTFNNTNGDATITSLSNGWYRVSITHPSSGYNTRLFKLYLSNSEVSSNTIPSYQGDGLKGVYIYGAQVELGSYATSYIPTQGSAVTRLADTCSQTVPDGVIGQTEGTVYWEIDVQTTVATGNENILNIDNGSGFGHTIYFSKSATGNLVGEMYVSGGLQASFTKTNITKGVHKMAMAYANNNTAFFVDGVQVGVTDTSCTIPSLSRIQLGNGVLGASDCLSNDLKLYNTRLSNSELASLTS